MFSFNITAVTASENQFYILDDSGCLHVQNPSDPENDFDLGVLDTPPSDPILLLRGFELLIGQSNKLLQVNLLSKFITPLFTEFTSIKSLSINSAYLVVTHDRYITLWHKGNPVFLCQPPFLPTFAIYLDETMIVAGEESTICCYSVKGAKNGVEEATMRGIKVLKEVKKGLVVAGGLGPRLDLFSGMKRICSLFV